jgi:hypothetical protein
VRFVGHGHPAIRATHRKTLELTTDADVTERATCVVAVDVDGVGAPIAGDVQLTLRVRDESFTFEARANSSWQPSGPAVIRRSAARLPGTFATHASAASSDLPRALVAALREPAADVELVVEHANAQRPCAVLYALDLERVPDASLAAEFAAADVVIAEDDGAAHAMGMRVTRGAAAVAGRVLVIATQDLPGQTVAAALRGVDVETVGLPPMLAAAAASPSRAPLVVGGANVDARNLLRDAPAGSRVALAVPAEQVATVLRMAADIRGSSEAVLVRARAAPIRVGAEDAPLTGKETAYLCIDAVAGADALDPRVRAAIDALVADGVATKTAAAALAALTGWDRRRAYDAVLSWAASGVTGR